MTYDYAHARVGVAGRLIERFGAIASLRRGSTDRACKVYVDEFSARERMGRMITDDSVLGLLSDVGLTVPPSSELDQLVTYVPDSSPPVVDKIYRIVDTPLKIAPAGRVMYWELRLIARK